MEKTTVQDIETRISQINPEGVDKLLGRLRQAKGKPAAPGTTRRRFDPALDANFRLEIGSAGNFDSLSCHLCPRVPPAPGELEVEVYAGGMNFRDVMIALGVYPTAPGEIPALGGDFAGKIVAVGDGVEGFSIGDEVMGIGKHCFGAYVNVEADDTLHKPQHMTFEEAVTIPVVFYTVYIALRAQADLWPGESILIHSAAGGVGLAAIQYARKVGAEIFATAGTPEKRDYVRALGVEHVMDSRSLAFVEETLAATNDEGVDVILNSLAGQAILKGLELLRPFGRLIDIGKRDIVEDMQVGLLPFAKGISFCSISLGLMDRCRIGFRKRMAAELTQWFSDGTLQPLPFRSYSIAKARDAFVHMSEGKHIGKVVLSIKDQEVLLDAKSLATPNR